MPSKRSQDPLGWEKCRSHFLTEILTEIPTKMQMEISTMLGARLLKSLGMEKHRK